MKPIINTPGMLVLDHKPWLLSLGITCWSVDLSSHRAQRTSERRVAVWFMFAGIGAITWGTFFVVFAKRVQMIFDTKAGQIVKRKRSLMGYAQDVYPLERFRGAELEVSHGDNSTTHRPVLVFDGQPNLPVVSYYTNGSQPHRTVQTINAWLEQQTEPTQLDSAPRNP